MEGSVPVLKPMPLWQTVLFFGVPALLECAAIFWLMPLLDEAGAPLWANFAVFGSPLLLMAAAALTAMRLEGWPLTWASVRDRLRLNRMRGKGWAWSVGLALFNLSSYVGVAVLLSPLSEKFDPPEILLKVLGDSEHFLGYPMKGAWWMLGAWFLFYLVNVLGEEVWWRGYILPRQELQHGRWTWAVHGTCWTLFHVFYFADMVMILPGALALAWVCQREKSTWPGIVSHGLLNAMAAIRIVMGIIG